jgi:hypothetical protein
MNTSYLCILSILFGIAGAASAQGPVNYPEEPAFVSTKTRAEVAADVIEARRLGLMTNNDIEIVIVAEPRVARKSSAQIRAEFDEAQRLGLLTPAGERDTPIATPDQERQIAEAGRRTERNAVAAR